MEAAARWRSGDKTVAALRAPLRRSSPTHWEKVRIKEIGPAALRLLTCSRRSAWVNLQRRISQRPAK